MNIEELRKELVMLNAEYKVYLEKRNSTRDSILWTAYQAKLDSIDQHIEVLTRQLGVQYYGQQ